MIRLVGEGEPSSIQGWFAQVELDGHSSGQGDGKTTVYSKN